MATDQQPEEAATRPVAAAGSFASSFVQTMTYGRFRQQPGSAVTTQPRQAVANQVQPEAAASVPRHDPVLLEPAGNAGAELAEPVLASGVLAAASVQDAVAAQARMAQSQLAEPPAAVSAAPALGPTP